MMNYISGWKSSFKQRIPSLVFLTKIACLKELDSVYLIFFGLGIFEVVAYHTINNGNRDVKE